jgi:hypothetical protein
MKRFLMNVVAGVKKLGTQGSAPRTRRTRLGLESLEDRFAPSSVYADDWFCGNGPKPPYPPYANTLDRQINVLVNTRGL